jgi:hypothetical protein
MDTQTQTLSFTIATLNSNPSCRNQKRKVIFEYERFAERLIEVENMFYNQLFEDNEFTYHDLYIHYLQQYKDVCFWVGEVIKPKYWKVNEFYFNQLFEPIEK